QLPCQVVGILEAGVHALSTHGAMNMRGISQQEAASVAESFGAAVKDAVGREPVARLERQPRSSLVLKRRNHVREGDILFFSEIFGQDPDHSPPVRSAPRT